MTLDDFNSRLAEAVTTEAGQPIIANGQLQAVRAATGQVVAWAPPESCDPHNSSDEVHVAAEAVRILTNAAARVRQVQADPRLSMAAKSEDAARVWANAAARADAILLKAEAEAERFRAYERAFFAPEPVAEAVAELRDWQQREWFERLAADKVPDLVEAMGRGEHPDLLRALLRSPVPVPHGVQQLLSRLWEQYLERTRPNDLRAIKARRQRVDWLLEVARQVASAIPRPQSAGPVHRAAA